MQMFLQQHTGNILYNAELCVCAECLPLTLSQRRLGNLLCYTATSSDPISNTCVQLQPEFWLNLCVFPFHFPSALPKSKTLERILCANMNILCCFFKTDATVLWLWIQANWFLDLLEEYFKTIDKKIFELKKTVISSKLPYHRPSLNIVTFVMM